DHADRAIPEQRRQITRLPHGNIAVPEIRLLTARVVRVVIDGAASEAEEVVVAALQWTELRQVAEMPFPDERRPVAGFPQQRWQRRMLRRQADIRRGVGQRLLEADTQPVLIAPCDQPDTRG